MKNIIINFTREAFVLPLNLAFLFSGISLFAVSEWLNPLPNMFISESILSIVMGIEFLYLGILPYKASFQQKIRDRKLRSLSPNHHEHLLFQQLNQKNQERYLQIKKTYSKIKHNFAIQPHVIHGVLNTISKKLDSLMLKYIEIMISEQRYQYIIQDDEYVHAIKDMEASIELLEKEIKDMPNGVLKITKEQRIQILKKRINKLHNIQQQVKISNAYLDNIKDTIELIYEQSITPNELEKLDLQIDALLEEAEESYTLNINHYDIDNILVGLSPNKTSSINSQNDISKNEEKSKISSNKINE